jgi:tetratricopeptide (TPR) repeat protein
VAAHSDVVVDHIGFLGGPEVVRSKAMRNLRLLAGILERDPADGLAWIQRAECHASLGELDASIACYRRGLGWLEGGGPPTGKTGVAAEIATAYQQLGAALFERGAFPEALAALDRAVVLWPTLASSYALRGQTLARIGRWDDAIGAYGKALDLTEGSQPPDQPVVLEPWVVWRLKGMAEATVGRDDDARASLLRALALKPDLDDAH